MEEKKIKIIKTWSEFDSVRDIQVFLGFTNFYKKLFKNLNRIFYVFILIFQTTKLAKANIGANKKQPL